MKKAQNILKNIEPLTLNNVCCARGGRLLFSGLDIVLAPAVALGIYGANGVGKSSLLRGLAGFLPLDYEGDSILASTLHYIGHKNALKSTLSVDETLYDYRVLMGAQHNTSQIKIDTIKTSIGLGAMGAMWVRDLSAGQARRLALARLLLAPRPLWLLDEPFAALDGDGRIWFEQTIKDHLALGGAVMITSHNDTFSFLTQKIILGSHYAQ